MSCEAQFGSGWNSSANFRSMNTLTETMRRAPLNQKTVELFRNQALKVVDNAIDVFFEPEREVADGKAAYDQLTDLQRSLQAYTTRITGEQEKLHQAFYAATKEAAGQGHEPGRFDVGEAPSLVPDGKPLKDGYREVWDVRTDRVRPLEMNMEQYGELAQKMSSVLPLYGSVAMVPGPLAVSLKDHLKETLQWSSSSQASSQSSAEQETFRLLTLSAGKKQVRSSGSSSASEKGEMSRTTADERIMPGLHQIRNDVASLGFLPAKNLEHKLTQQVREYEKTSHIEGFFFKEKVVDKTEVNSATLTVATVDLPVLPDRMLVGGLRTNAGLDNPRAGSELVDLVDKAELNDEFLDQFRDGAAALIDSAVGTLFNTSREVADGREAYDKLSNLGRALSLAQSKWGESHYNSDLPAQIAALAEVTPLFACVAMVPGEMSSSVKNHAKELFEFQSQARSAAASQGRDWNVSLLGSVSETHEQSSSQAERSASVRYETTTTDERILPRLHDLKVKLDGLQITKGKLVL